MTDRYENIRKALAMGPTPGPWDGDDNSVSRLWSNGTAGIREYIALPDGAEGSAPNPADMHFIAACDPDTIRELLAERDRLAAENARLREALHVVSECGDPCKVTLYDEEGIEGWRWTHPDGREWEEVGEWCEDPPLHPVARAALSASEPMENDE